MKFWDYIGEFIFLRWLFGKLHHKEESNSNQSYHDYSYDHECSCDYECSYDHECSYDDFDNGYDYSAGDFDNDYDWDSQSFGDFYEDQDDYDIMDDF